MEDVITILGVIIVVGTLGPLLWWAATYGKDKFKPK